MSSFARTPELTFLLSLVMLTGVVAGTSEESVEEFVRSQVQGKLFTFRHFYVSNTLHYDHKGRVVGYPKRGPWTLAGFAVEQVELQGQMLLLRGFRVGRIGVYRLVRVPQPILVRLEIGPRPTVASMRRILDAIFIRPEEELAPLVPSYWRNALGGRNAEDLQVAGVTITAAETPAKTLPEKSCRPEKGEGGLWWRIPHATDFPPASSGAPPRPIVLARAKYTKQACLVVLQGVMILTVNLGADGKVHDVFILRPLGMGLDEEAIKALRRSKIRPATMNGSPTPVVFNMEANFRLY